MGFFDRFKTPAADASAAIPASGMVEQSRSLPVQSQYATEPSAQGGNGANQANIQQLVQQFLAGKPPGAQTLQQLKSYLAQQGINIEIPTHGGGQLSDDKIVLPDRSVIDLYGDIGGANTPTWAPDGYWVNGQPSSRPDMVVQEPEYGGLPAGYSLTGANRLASFDAPGINRPWTEQFSFNPQEMRDSPFYQFAQDEALNAVQKSRAAAGTLHTGGTLKAIAKYGGNVAGQQYGDEFDRRYRVYTGDKDTYFRNSDMVAGRLSDLANMGATAASSYANNVSALYNQQGNVNAARAGNPPLWLPAAQTGIAAGADAIFNRK